MQKIRAYAHVLDFFGGMFEIRNGKAVVPGGARSEKAWADLVGASPDKPGAVLRAPDRQRRRLAGQLFRRALAHQHNPVQRAGAGLSDRSRAPEAVLRRDPRQGHQPGPGASGVPLQHRHDAADRRGCAWIRTESRTSPAAWRSGRPCSSNILRQRQVRRQAEPRRRPAGKSPTTCWRRCSGSAARQWRTSR